MMSVIGESAGKFSIRWEEARALVSVKTYGLWTVEDFDLFYPQVSLAFDRSRARLGHALAMIDCAEAHVQTGELIDYMRTRGIVISRPGDRVAVVVASSLLKLQMKRVTETVDTVHYFLSQSAATTWLHAHSVPVV